MALLSVDLKQFGCCSRTILKSPLIVRTFYATSPRKRVQDNLNFVINHVNSNPANKNDFLVSFGVKVSGYLLKGRNVTALACFPPKLAFFQGLLRRRQLKIAYKCNADDTKGTYPSVHTTEVYSMLHLQLSFSSLYAHLSMIL